MKQHKNIVAFLVITIAFVMLIRYALIKSMSLGELSLARAIQEIGVKETPAGSNRGKEVEAYLRSTGLPGGHPWCMAFVYWCVQEAAKAKGVPNPLFRTAGVLRQARERKNLSSKVPKVGAIFIMNYGGGLGHTGFVEKIEGNWIVTVEGNTDGAGSRTGGQVMRQRRSLTSIQEYLYI